MKDGPDIATIASLLGDPGRANMLTALMAGQALTAGGSAGSGARAEGGIRTRTP